MTKQLILNMQIQLYISELGTGRFQLLFLNLQLLVVGVSDGQQEEVGGAPGPSSKTGVTLFGYDLFPRATGEDCWIQVIAVGKWK